MHNTTYTQWVGKTLPALTIGALTQGEQAALPQEELVLKVVCYSS